MAAEPPALLEHNLTLDEQHHIAPLGGVVKTFQVMQLSLIHGSDDTICANTRHVR